MMRIFIAKKNMESQKVVGIHLITGAKGMFGNDPIHP
jgi:hypothetical protein